jgi:hypothetical protein
MGRGQWLILERDAMPTITIRYSLPDEQHEYDCARVGQAACACLWDIDQALRSLIKHGEPSEETQRWAEEVREMIRQGCPEALEL